MTAPSLPRVVPLGDAALLAEFSAVLDLDVNARIQQLALDIRGRQLDWIRDVVPALGSLALHFEPARFAPDFSPIDAATTLLHECLNQPPTAAASDAPSVDVPICYAPACAPDLDDIAARCGITVDEVVALHCASPHRVLMVGFVPGHPYIGGLDRRISVPRRTTPRAKVAAGSVAIANAQTVVYPFTTPGGWNIVGRTPLRVFDATREPPAIFAPGQRVRFVPIDLDAFRSLAADADGERS